MFKNRALDNLGVVCLRWVTCWLFVFLAKMIGAKCVFEKYSQILPFDFFPPTIPKHARAAGLLIFMLTNYSN